MAQTGGTRYALRAGQRVGGSGMAGAMHYIGSLVLILWLIVGAVAAGQRHEYTRPPANCSQAATIAVTIIAGPLNYLGVNPKISCRHVPQPSR
jgi:hypothetical protein